MPAGLVFGPEGALPPKFKRMKSAKRKVWYWSEAEKKRKVWTKSASEKRRKAELSERKRKAELPERKKERDDMLRRRAQRRKEKKERKKAQDKMERGLQKVLEESTTKFSGVIDAKLAETKGELQKTASGVGAAAADAALLAKVKRNVTEYVKDQRDLTAEITAATTLGEIQTALDDALLKGQIVAALATLGGQFSAVELRDGKPTFLEKLMDKAKA